MFLFQHQKNNSKMSSKILFTIFLVIFCGVSTSNAQLCIPDPVETLIMYENNTLSWTASENCPSTQYMVIIETGGVIEYEYTVNSLSLNLSFLKLCRSYNFTVTPTADHILGLETSLQSSIALPNDVDIAIQNFTGAQVGEDVLLQWLVNENYTYCVGYYRLLIWNEDSDTPESVYVGQNGYMIEHVAQCMNYTFELTAFYNNINGTTEQYNYTVPEEPNAPTLVEIRQDTTVINTTWSLEKYRYNRCNITALYVNSTHFNQTYDIVDSPDRPDVIVSITGLRANSLYYFNVTTLNSAGLSKPYQLGVQTLPLDPTLD